MYHLLPASSEVEEGRYRFVGKDERRRDEDGESAEETFVADGKERGKVIHGHDLLFDDPLFRKIPPESPAGSVSVTDLRNQVALLSAAPGKSGESAYEEEAAQEAFADVAGTGVADLDALVGDAFGAYGITEVSGVSTTQVVGYSGLCCLSMITRVSGALDGSPASGPAPRVVCLLDHL